MVEIGADCQTHPQHVVQKCSEDLHNIPDVGMINILISNKYLAMANQTPQKYKDYISYQLYEDHHINKVNSHHW